MYVCMYVCMPLFTVSRLVRYVIRKVLSLSQEGNVIMYILTIMIIQI